jgi:cell division septation protein DedD
VATAATPPAASPPAATPPAAAPRPIATAESRPAADQQGAKTGVPAKAADTPAGGKWWVQVGSFSSRDNAQRVAQKLRDGGYTMDVSRTRQNGKDLYRVRAGPVADREAAAALQARLIAAGQKNPSLVPP